MRTTLYAAYGSNLNIKQMAFRCPTAKPIAKAWLHDHRLVFKGYSRNAHATVIPEKGQDVPLVIWEITARDEAALDRYEGVAGGYYTREHVQVEVAGEMKEVLIYIMTPQDFGTPSYHYFSTVRDGYEDFNFPVDVLNDALKYSYSESIVYLKKAGGRKNGNKIHKIS